jgi:YHS domain-containing protein
MNDPGRIMVARAALVATACLLFGGCTSSPPPAPAVASDPVCGAVVNPEKSLHVTYAGHVYYFDSPECRTEFLTHTAAYTGLQPRHTGR